MSKQLVKGFYWVRYGTGWTVAEFSPFYDEDNDYGSWYICGNECAIMTKELDEINEAPLTEPGKIPQRTAAVSVFDQFGRDINSTLTIEGIKVLSVLKSLFKKRVNGR